MSWFSEFIKNPLGTVADIVEAPFESLGNIAKGKMTIGDIFNVAAPFLAPGTNPLDFSNYALKNFGTASLLNSGGIPTKDISKMNTTELLQYATTLSGGKGADIPISSYDSETQKYLMDIYGELAKRQAEFNLERQPRTFSAQDRAYNALDESSVLGQTEIVRNRLLREADEAGKRAATQLANRGYASSVSDAAILDANNRAVDQGNQIASEYTSPEQRANRAIAQSQIYKGDNAALSTLIGLQGQQNAQRIADAQYEASRPPTLLESLLPVIGNIAGEYDIFGTDRDNVNKSSSESYSSKSTVKNATKQKLGGASSGVTYGFGRGTFGD